MSKDDDEKERPIPAQVRAAFDYLRHIQQITDPFGSSLPIRELTPLENSVYSTALRAIQLYLLGEMEYESAPRAVTEPAKVDA